MKTVYFLAGVSLTILLAACATIRGSGDVDQGRQALLEGHYQRALRPTLSHSSVDRQIPRMYMALSCGAASRAIWAEPNT